MTPDYKTLEETILLFWDSKENFNSDKTQMKIGQQMFQEVILIDSLQTFEDTLRRSFPPNQKFLFFVHLNHNDENIGFHSFISSKILKNYPKLSYFLVSSAPKHTIYVDGKNNELDVYSYHHIHENISTRFIRQTIDEIKGTTITSHEGPAPLAYPQIDYAILTALYDDEFEEVKAMFDWVPNSENIKTETKLFYIGNVKNRPNKKIVVGVAPASGMVDSSVVATMMLEMFRPKYMLMSGVCGGLPELNFGSIVVASKVFTFQKGKISDVKDSKSNKIVEVFDKDGDAVDISKLYDKEGNQLHVSIEKFEIEHDDMPTLDTLILDKINDAKKEITDEINRPYKNDSEKIKITMAPMACSTMVVDKTGYFIENIKNVDRKALAVEMEGYGVARACKLANNGRTKFIVFKAIMDNTTSKSDTFKSKAAYTSAMFLKLLLEKDII